MAPHSSTLAWKIPWMEEPGRLQSMGSLSWTRLSDFTFTFPFHALEKEMATHSSVLAWRIPGKGSLVGCRLWGRTESDTTEATQQQQGIPHSSVGKESACNAGELDSIPGSGRSPGEGNGNPLQYSCLENLMDRGAWQATGHGAARVGHNLATKERERGHY